MRSDPSRQVGGAVECRESVQAYLTQPASRSRGRLLCGTVSRICRRGGVAAVRDDLTTAGGGLDATARLRRSCVPVSGGPLGLAGEVFRMGITANTDTPGGGAGIDV